MELAGGKLGFFRNVVVRFLLFSLLVVGVRFAYVITIRGESCRAGDDFCFFSGSTGNQNLVTAAGVRIGSSSVTLNPTAAASPEFQKRVMFYITVFQDLIVDGFLSTKSKSLCVETPVGDDVYALREIGVDHSVGIFKKTMKPLVINGLGHRHPFNNNTFDFIFSGNGAVDKSANAAAFAAEIGRTLKPEGYVVVHTASTDTYSFNSFIRLFNCCTFIRSRHITGLDSDMPHIHEMVMKKQIDIKIRSKTDINSVNRCSVPGYKQDLLRNSEPLIESEPLKPWITLKKNIEKVKYLPSMVDINFKQRYVYIDVGARSYGSSIVSWFKKQYPKQNKTFDIYAIEADTHFHDQYKSKKGVTLLPYAAWVRNESLVFEINQTPGDENVEKGRGMGRIQAVESGGGIVGSTDVIQGFDFADWLKNTVSEKDFVVMKMDVEGTEFDLIPRLIETEAICLIDEVFLECHYNRWQKCCPGVRSPKYQKSYGQCLDLFKSLRQRGVLVHQWW
ncbi:hypothetical protein L1987_83109 [Smallanthus sonchifolius]|uniref:Uncharacterized protein n=1 Tax=Smallanthus sonchifolius TaxID=185202 RepID=A0ACB8YCQ0_9ASTR|nr:hypothetical protein L1987_83109 [Smallanthus sonchifolius]